MICFLNTYFIPNQSSSMRGQLALMHVLVHCEGPSGRTSTTLRCHILSTSSYLIWGKAGRVLLVLLGWPGPSQKMADFINANSAWTCDIVSGFGIIIPKWACVWSACPTYIPSFWLDVGVGIETVGWARHRLDSSDSCVQFCFWVLCSTSLRYVWALVCLMCIN